MEATSLALGIVGIAVGVMAVVVTYLLYEATKDQAARAEGALASVSSAVAALEARQGTLNVTDLRELLTLSATRVIERGSLSGDAEAAMQDLILEAMKRAGIRSNEQLSEQYKADVRWFEGAEHRYGQNSVAFAVLRRVRQLSADGDTVLVRHIGSLLAPDITLDALLAAVTSLVNNGNLACDTEPPTADSSIAIR